MGDSFAVFRLPLLVSFALIVVWSPWPGRVRWPLTGLALVLMVPFAFARFTAPAPVESDTLRLYQQNLRFDRADHESWLAHVAETKADMITLQEVSGANKILLAALSDSHPVQHFCEFGGVGGVAVLSRFAMVPGTARCAERNGLAAMQVDTPLGVVWLVSVHLHWPWPYRQAAQLDRLVPELAALSGPVILAGDFNAVAWSHTMRQVERATGSLRIPHAEASFHLPWIAMPVTIDHALAPDGWRGAVTRMPKAGSDHHGLLVHLAKGAT